MMDERGFRVVTFSEMREMKVSQMKPRPKVVFVNRRKAFQPPSDTLAQYIELKRRAKSNPRIDLRQSAFGERYRNRYGHKIIRSNDAMGQLRRLAEESRERPVLMVIDKDRPDGEILVELVNHMMASGAW